MTFADQARALNTRNALRSRGGCMCNCKGECEPKGCGKLFGRSIQSRNVKLPVFVPLTNLSLLLKLLK